jgi:LPXTG-site transpeptidase (sortase) family protein
MSTYRYNFPTIVRSKYFFKIISPAFLAVFFILGTFWTPTISYAVAPNLTITPITWNVVGLDTEDVSRGPNTFPVGVRVCNTGDTEATNVRVGFVWAEEDPSPYIELLVPEEGEFEFESLPDGDCVDVYFTIAITRNAAAYGASSGYYIAVTENDNPASVKYTPGNREIYVERLNPSSSLSVTEISGPTTLLVGETYQFEVTSSASDVRYEQLEHYLNFASENFQITRVQARYTHPFSASNDKLYADACGWENDITSADYLTCTGPETYPTASVGGEITTTYSIQALTPGTATLIPTIYGFNETEEDGEFEYNGDYGSESLTIRAVVPSMVSLPFVERQTTPTVPPATPTLTVTPTATGTISANPSLSKISNRTQIAFGESLTFTITIRNNGTAPALDTRLTDSLEAYTYLRVSNPTTTRGTASITGTGNRTVSVNIGRINPGEVVTVTFEVGVTTTPATTQSLFNTATVSWEWPEDDTDTTRQTRSVTSSVFTVRGGTTLPGTGELPFESPNGVINDITLPALVVAGVLVVLSLILLLKKNGIFKSGKGWYWGIGVLLFALVGTAVFKLLSPAEQTGIDLQVDMSGGVVPEANGIAFAPTATINPLFTLPAYLFGTPHPIETLPSYPIPTPTLIPSGADGSTPDISPIVRIAIPSLGLDTKVAYVPFDGQTWLIQGLREEVAWMGDTSWPGLGGNTGLAGHITVRDLGAGPFRYLDDLLQNDTVYLYTEENMYTYSVRDKAVVEQDDLSVIAVTDSPRITLITCLEWDDNLKIYLKRLAVIADLVRTDPLNVSSSN